MKDSKTFKKLSELWNHLMSNKKNVIGLIQNVVVHGTNTKKKVQAKVDTGATRSSIDINLAAELQLGPIIKSKKVKSAHGNTRRPVVVANVTVHGKLLKTEFTLADREHMKYRVLVGQNTLKEGKFLIDPSN